MKKRLFAFVLAVCMVLSLVPVAQAANPVFTDVDTDSWYADAIRFAYENGLMNGIGEGQFAPNGAVSRAMVWTTLARQAGVDTEGGETWWAIAREWAMENGISDGTFADNDVTREQLVTMLYRYAKYKGFDVSKTTSLSTYSDNTKVSAWALDAMGWATAIGMINGIGNELRPQSTASRAQLATVLQRYDTTIEIVLPTYHTVTFLWNDGDDGVYRTVEVADGETVGSVAAPTRTGYRFTGWETADGADFALDTPITADTTLLAGWTRYIVIVHTHSFPTWTSDNAGNHSATCECGETVTEPCEWGNLISNDNGTHTRKCGKCGHTETADCTLATAANGNGTHTRTCADCGFVKTEPCSITIPDGSGAPACALCGFSDVIVVDSIDALKAALTAKTDEVYTNDGKVILLKKGEYTLSARFDVHDINITIIGERNPDGSIGVTITQTTGNHVFHIENTDDSTNTRCHVILSSMKFVDGKAGVENRGNTTTDLYDMIIDSDNTVWQAIALDIGSDDANNIKVIVNAHNVQTTNNRHAQVNAKPRDNFSGGIDHFNYAEFNFDAACSDSFKTNNGFVNMESGNIGKENIKINGVFYQPTDYSIDKNGNIEIYTASGLKRFSQYFLNIDNGLKDKTVTLVNNLTLTEAFTPIGTAEKPFKGTFDGNGKTISGLNINLPEADNVGLFAVVDGEVKNLTIEGATVTGKTNVGVIAGSVGATGKITNCTVNGGIGGGFVMADANGGSIAGAVAAGSTVTNNTITKFGVICTDETDGASVLANKLGAIVGDNTAAVDLSSNTVTDVGVAMAYAYDATTNTYSVATPAALTKAFGLAATVGKTAPTITLACGIFDTIVIPNNSNGTETRLAGLTLNSSKAAVVGHLDLNCADNITIDGLVFNAAKAASALQSATDYESISSGSRTMKSGCENVLIKNCLFNGTCPQGAYNCIRFYEQGRSANTKNITIQGCTFACNAQQYLRLDYISGTVTIEENTFGGNGFGTSHNSINATNNNAHFKIIENAFYNWFTPYQNSLTYTSGYAFGSSWGSSTAALTATDNTFTNTAGGALWLKNYADRTVVTLSDNTYAGGLTQTDANAILYE